MHTKLAVPSLRHLLQYSLESVALGPILLGIYLLVPFVPISMHANPVVPSLRHLLQYSLESFIFCREFVIIISNSILHWDHQHCRLCHCLVQETFQEFGLGFPDPDLHHYSQGLPGILASSSRRHRKIHGLSSCRWSFDDIDDKSSHFPNPKKTFYERIYDSFFLILLCVVKLPFRKRYQPTSPNALR